jgi:hypothetical protein
VEDWATKNREAANGVTTVKISRPIRLGHHPNTLLANPGPNEAPNITPKTPSIPKRNSCGMRGFIPHNDTPVTAAIAPSIQAKGIAIK